MRIEEPTSGTEPLAVATRLDGVDRLTPPHPMLVAARAPAGAAAEAYRHLYASRRRTLGGAPLGMLGVASAARGDGRTTTAANLAFIAARESGREVALVDADLRRPGLHDLVGCDGDVGLSDVLAHRSDPEAALWSHPDGVVVVAGGRPDPEPARRLRHPRLQHLFALLRRRCDEIVVDLPPLAFAEARLLLGHCDGAVLVVRAGRTEARLVADLASDAAQLKLLGTVLNGAEEADAPRLAALRRALPGGR